MIYSSCFVDSPPASESSFGQLSSSPFSMSPVWQVCPAYPEVSSFQLYIPAQLQFESVTLYVSMIQILKTFRSDESFDCDRMEILMKLLQSENQGFCLYDCFSKQKHCQLVKFVVKSRFDVLENFIQMRAWKQSITEAYGVR